MTKKQITLSLILCFALFLSACGTQSQATPTTDPAAVYTAAAQTASVRLTQMLAQTPSPLPETPTPTLDVTLTAAAQTLAAQLTQTAALASTPLPTHTATSPVVSGVDRALFVSETIPDGTDFLPNQDFDKTWRLRNTGTSTWTTDYYLVFISGEQMGGPDSQRLTANVPPNGEVDLTVDLVAPATPGRYRGYWKLLNAAGKFFDDPFYVEIDVVSSLTGPTPTTAPTSSSSTTTITNLAMTVDNASIVGACPQTFTFVATFDLATTALVTYQLEAGSTTPGVNFELPAAQTVQMPAGTQTLSFPLTFTTSREAWVRLHITSPVDMTSNPANFTLVCQS